jgi:hypothetical protein
MTRLKHDTTKVVLYVPLMSDLSGRCGTMLQT